MKITVLYHSVSGTTREMAENICQGINSVEGMEGKAFPLSDIDAAYIGDSKCVILGTPVYYACMAGEVKIWFEKAARQYGLAGKLGGAIATADYVHGGAELAIQNILTHMMVYGMPVYSGGGSYGKPVIHLGPVAIKENAGQYEETFRTYGARMAIKTAGLFG